ncbi:MAG: S-layer homology domain-containing protein [Clostridia bacterium]|nr:S-layer homology domain-containing protein [Clostridia bacterium]
MRNLKRTLSLILALTMLLGMVTTGVSAAETTAAEAPAAVTVGAFKDADQITYTEEVSIMAGMGLFAGTTDGTFDPLGTVTRAQMVTVLVKALRGNEFNANAFKGAGVNPFSDTAVFEGGWAEGYITAGHQMGIVGGYGDGTFKPGKAVTTAEALTMIINALKVDAGEGEWPSTIMAKAEEMKLYGELKTKPATNDPMNREQLAVVTYEGMCYSPKGVSGYRVADPSVDIVFTDIADAIKVNGGVSGITEVVGEDALANQIYELKIAKGFVTANQSTGHEQTTIRPVQDDGTLGDEVDYFVQTDLDMVGHYVTVYYKEAYKNEKEPGQVYTIVDETTVVEVKEDITTPKDYKAAFGKSYQMKKDTESSNKVVLFDKEYRHNNVVGTVPDSDDDTAYAAGNTAPAGTYFIADNAVVGYMAPVTKYASYIVDINKYEGSESVQIAGANGEKSIPNTAGDDQIVEYRGMIVGDYVTYVKVQDVYVLELSTPFRVLLPEPLKKRWMG